MKLTLSLLTALLLAPLTFGRFDKPDVQASFGGKTPISYSSDFGETWTYAASEFPVVSSAQRQVLIRLREHLQSRLDQATATGTQSMKSILALLTALLLAPLVGLHASEAPSPDVALP